MELILTAITAALLVWAMVYCVQGSLVMGALAVVIAGVCLGHPFWNMDLGLVPLTLDRLLLVGLVAAYVVQGRLGRTAPKPIGPADRWLGGLLVVLTANFLCTGFSLEKLEQGSAVWRLASGYWIPALVYWVARQSPMDHRTVRRVWGGLSWLGVYLAVTGILEKNQQWWAVFPRYIADPQVGLHFGRARGPMVHAVSFGFYVAVCGVAAFFWSWGKGRWARLAFLGALPLFGVALLFSFTRSVWLGAALAGLVLIGLGLRGRIRIVALASLLILGSLIAIANRDRLIAFERESSASETAQSVRMRGAFAYVSWQMFLDRPIFGFGFGRFPKAKLPYLADRQTDLPLESIRDYVHHNTFLSLLTETGLVGLGMFLGLLAAWAQTAWKLIHTLHYTPWAQAQGLFFSAVLACYLCQALFHEMSYLPTDHILIFFLAGLTVGIERTGVRVSSLGSAPVSGVGG